MYKIIIFCKITSWINYKKSNNKNKAINITSPTQYPLINKIIYTNIIKLVFTTWLVYNIKIICIHSRKSIKMVKNTINYIIKG